MGWVLENNIMIADVRYKKSNVVSVSNNLIGAKYRLGLVEKRLLYAFIGGINNNICLDIGKERDCLEVLSSDKVYTLSVESYAKQYNITYEVAKDELREAVDRLFQQQVTYTASDASIVTTRWISSKIKYIKNEHILALKWASDIIPLISELRKHFTSLNIRCLSTLPSVYSLRLYEIFIMELRKCRKHSIKIELEIDMLRELFVLEDKYTVFANLMKRVIEEPISSINKDINCNILVEIEDENGKRMYKKLGKKVVAIGFKISWRHNEQVKTSN